MKFQFFPTLRIASCLILSILNTLECTVVNTFSALSCSPEHFYQPYAKLYKTRKRITLLASRYKSGFLNLRSLTGILCLNGPVIVYTENKKYKNRLIWAPGEAQIFSHECFKSNQNGHKITGVYLPVNSTTDYRESSFILFGHRDLSYDPKKSKITPMEGASLIIIAPEKTEEQTTQMHCIQSDHLNRQALFKVQLTDSKKICFRNEDNSEYLDDQLFYQNVSFTEFKNEPCELPSESEESNILESSENSNEISKPPTMDDFRVIDPDKMTSRSGRGVPLAAMRAKKKQAEKPAKVSTYHKKFPPGFYLFPEEETPRKKRISPIETFSTEVEECEEFPEAPENSTCPEIADELKTNTSCHLLSHLLTIEQVDWKSPELIKSSWRVPIWTSIEKIFMKVCPEISHIMAPAVGRIIQYYFSRMLDNEEKKMALQLNTNPTWKNLKVELDKCLRSAKPMQFRRVRNFKAEKRKKELEKRILEGRWNETRMHKEVQDLENDRNIKFPFFIKVIKDGKPVKLFYYQEAVELEFDLNWAVDIHWKIFSTVLGYCNTAYSMKEQSVFMNLYSTYTEDVLDLLMDDWLSPKDNPTLKELLGEFIFGSGGYWLDSCMEGSYIFANVPDYRPPRPIDLPLEDDSSQEFNEKQSNYFIKKPKNM